ncbi:hypothetical protein ACHAXH_005469 [Discostella pseudostelligera]
MFDPESFDYWHIAKATLLAAIATLFLIFQQTRYTFRQTREAYVTHLQQRDRNNKAASLIVEATSKNKGKKKNTIQSVKDSAADAASDDANDNGAFVIGFFHPYCSAGGGGERVLWKFIQALGELKEENLEGKKKTVLTQNRRSKTKKENESNLHSTATNHGKGDEDIIRRNCRNLSVVVYTVDEPTDNYDQNVMKKVREQFSIGISPSLHIQFVHLHEVKYLLDKPKRLSMIAESWGTVKLAWYALNVINPHIYIDTTGCAFTLLVAKLLAGCKIGTYVHYPTISSDMLSLVWARRPSYNNNTQIAANPIVSYVKLVYYTIFAIGYGMVGSLADLTMVNSSWTKGHIQQMWKLAGKIHILFPPCDTKSLKYLPLSKRENIIISIGQFRPEKDHTLQLTSFAKLLQLHDGAMKRVDVSLVLIGSCRGEDDEKRVDELRKLSRELHIQDRVEFVLNQPYSVLLVYFRRASVGIHTMWNEHFGIGVVEMMAAGLVTVAHNSGGPKSDIILRPWDFKNNEKTAATGCLASTIDEYATAMYEILSREPDEILDIRQCGRNSSERFSDEEFMHSLKEILLSSSLFKLR